MQYGDTMFQIKVTETHSEVERPHSGITPLLADLKLFEHPCCFFLDT